MRCTNPRTHSLTLRFTCWRCVGRHRRLRSTGQRLGAAGTLIHLQRHVQSSSSESASSSSSCTPAAHQLNQFTMNVANVGDVEAVLCRHGEPLLLTKKFVTSADRDECQRVAAADGIITEVSAGSPATIIKPPPA